MRYACDCKTGRGNVDVQVLYDVDGDGDFDGWKVMFNGVDISNAISDSDTYKLEIKVWDHYDAECIDHNNDAKIDAYLSNREKL